MTIDDLAELHYITPIANVASVLKQGVLSHNAAEAVPHQSVAMPEVQERRDRKVVPGGMPLHDYANLYLCARNPMMYKRHEGHADLCVLRISTAVLYLPGAIIASGNASSAYTRFAASPSGLQQLDAGLVFAHDWTDSDQYAYWRKKAAKCAEVLVPHRVEPELILGAHVSCEAAACKLERLAPGLRVSVSPQLFFLPGG